MRPRSFDFGQTFNLVVGLCGLGLMTWFVWQAKRVIGSPGDDNPIVILFVLAALLSAWPAWGLCLWARRRPLRKAPFWALVSVVLIIGLGRFALVFS